MPRALTPEEAAIEEHSTVTASLRKRVRTFLRGRWYSQAIEAMFIIGAVGTWWKLGNKNWVGVLDWGLGLIVLTVIQVMNLCQRLNTSEDLLKDMARYLGLD